MVEIIPSILTSDPREVEAKIASCEGVVERVQIDIIDGVFAVTRTIDPSFLEGVDSPLNFDYHLMTKEPSLWVEKAARGGADRVIGQIEQMGSQIEFIGKVSEIGLSVGLALDIETKVSSLDPVVLTNLDVILVMSVKAGAGGQKFEKPSLAKIRKLDEIRARDDTPFKICVDGGITEENISQVVAAGADEVVIGERIFAGDLIKNLEKFKKAAYG
ncbi:MAG: hypothetical protein ACOYT7_04005 [Patescibacteria group bacterium]